MARKGGQNCVESGLNFRDGFLEGTPVKKKNSRLLAANEGGNQQLQRSVRPESMLSERKTRVN